MARILIADDQEMMRDSLAAILAREGHEIFAASDGPSALARIGGTRIDLVITDMKMPRMTGIELLAELHRIDGVLHRAIRRQCDEARRV